MEKVKEEQKVKDIKLQFQLLREFMDSNISEDKKIVFRDSTTIYFVKIKDILHCEASGSNTTFFLQDETKITVSKPLKEFENMLESDHFIRTHHSHLVNISQIKRLDKTDGGSVVLSNGVHVPISQRKWEQVLLLLNV